ncbi:MAG TPA: divalent-cation tolerance protein CutA [Planctomycetota bacterium]|nr:divalent-cation tolerance protein CutA [Planctomycetota bacterium]
MATRIKSKTAVQPLPDAPKKAGQTSWTERRQAFAKSDPLRVVFVTAPEKEAETIARKLLEERLIACANLLKGVQSLYWWEGKIGESAETLIVMKTPASKINALMKRVRELHSYSVPEFLALGIMEANPAYAAWARKETESEFK